MRPHRFIGDYKLAVGTIAVADAALVNQLKNVFRLVPGDGVLLGDGRGQEARAAILGFTKATVEFDIEEVHAVLTESPRRVTLYCAVLKRENFEFVAEKATEAGMAELVPVVSERTVKTGLRADRIEKIIREAAEQSGRGVLPLLRGPMTFKEALADMRRHDLNIIFELNQPSLAAHEIAARAPASVGVFIGPEGGWTDEEVSAAKLSGAQAAGLGRRVLRAETAATVATFIVAGAGE